MRQTDAGVSSCSFDDRRAWTNQFCNDEKPLFLSLSASTRLTSIQRVFDEEKRRAIFDRTARIEIFGFDQNFAARFSTQLRQTNQRRTEENSS